MTAIQHIIACVVWIDDIHDDLHKIAFFASVYFVSLLRTFFQDMFNKLLSTSGTTNHGTLLQIKNNFSHRNVTSNVMNCFNYAENFVR